MKEKIVDVPPEYLQRFSMGQPILVEASCHVLVDARTNNNKSLFSSQEDVTVNNLQQLHNMQ